MCCCNGVLLWRHIASHCKVLYDTVWMLMCHNQRQTLWVWARNPRVIRSKHICTSILGSQKALRALWEQRIDMCWWQLWVRRGPMGAQLNCRLLGIWNELAVAMVTFLSAIRPRTRPCVSNNRCTSISRIGRLPRINPTDRNPTLTKPKFKKMWKTVLSKRERSLASFAFSQIARSI